MSITVVKVGGSLSETDAIRPVMRLLALRARSEPIVVVPGGGGFADAVRAAQRRHGFADGAAHHMALLAMLAHGRMLVDLEPAFGLAETLDACRDLLAQGRGAVCVPVHELLADPDVPAAWDVTSDSVSAWLAARLPAHRLLLVKSAAVPPEHARDAEALMHLGIVDQRFPRMAATLEGRWIAVSGPAGLGAELG